jgi:hypothetical protein
MNSECAADMGMTISINMTDLSECWDCKKNIKSK